MLKTIFGLMLIVISGIGGFWFSLRFKKKREFYSDFSLFNQLMQREVGFSKRTLREIFSSADYGESFMQVIKDFEERKEIKTSILTERENEYVRNYFDGLGKTDSITQLAFLNAQKTVIDCCLNGAREDERKYRPFCIKMGFLIGLVLFVLSL